jgi:hypothetical protein
MRGQCLETLAELMPWKLLQEALAGSWVRYEGYSRKQSRQVPCPPEASWMDGWSTYTLNTALNPLWILGYTSKYLAKSTDAYGGY